MLNKSSLPDESISTYVELMIWLSAQYGPTKKPAVPKVIKPEPPIHERRWTEDDPRTVFAWAESEAAYLSELCEMEDWAVQVAPNGNKARLHPISATTAYLKPLRSNAWCENKNPGYFVDYFGRPTLFYDPRQCAEAGYFAKTLLPQFALLKIYAKHPPIDFNARELETLVYMTVCHMGLGFTLLALAQNNQPQNWTAMAMLNAYTPHDEELPYLYGTLIGLAAHRLTPEQIVANYGPIITKRTRKLIKPSLDQIETQSNILKLLRLFTRPNRNELPEHSHPHSVQLSSGLA